MATQKQVVVLARYTHKTDGKPNGTVSYLVRSSDGKSTYCTTIVNAKASGCSCPSRSPKGCYHKHQLEAQEQQRQEIAQQFAAKSTPTWMLQLVNAGKLVAPKPAQKLVASPVIEEPKAKPKITDISTKGALNGSKPFSILKSAS
jgi:hypothetical protein